MPELDCFQVKWKPVHSPETGQGNETEPFCDSTNGRTALMAGPPQNVLVLCTGNSTRSILAEALFNKHGAGALTAHSAGSQPKGEPHPAALELLRQRGIDPSFARSKSWDEFATLEAPEFDLIVTVCDSAASETCPVWPGHPMTVHWGIPDPAAVTDSPQATAEAFAIAYDRLEARIAAFFDLPFTTLTPDAFKQAARRIGAMDGATERAAIAS